MNHSKRRQEQADTGTVHGWRSHSWPSFMKIIDVSEANGKGITVQETLESNLGAFFLLLFAVNEAKFPYSDFESVRGRHIYYTTSPPSF